MTNRFRVLGMLSQRLEELSMSPVADLRHAGLPIGLFEHQRILLTTEEMFALYRAIYGVSGDPAVRLKLGTEERIERYDPIAIAALDTRSFRDTLQRVARYKQLTCPEEIQIAERGDECAVQFLWLLTDKIEPAPVIDLCLPGLSPSAVEELDSGSIPSAANSSVRNLTGKSTNHCRALIRVYPQSPEEQQARTMLTQLKSGAR